MPSCAPHPEAMTIRRAGHGVLREESKGNDIGKKIARGTFQPEPCKEKGQPEEMRKKRSRSATSGTPSARTMSEREIRQEGLSKRNTFLWRSFTLSCHVSLQRSSAMCLISALGQRFPAMSSLPLCWGCQPPHPKRHTDQKRREDGEIDEHGRAKPKHTLEDLSKNIRSLDLYSAQRKQST